MVVGQIPERYIPPGRSAFENGVAGVRRSCLYGVDDGPFADISRAADTAGIDDKATVSQSYDARDMRMPTQDQRLSNTEGFGFDVIDWACLNDGGVVHAVQPIG